MAGQYVILEESIPGARKAAQAFWLAVEMTRADLKARQFQRLLGPVWWLMEPLVMGVGYYILTSRLGYSTGPGHYVFILIGTTIWRSFSKCLDVSLNAYVNFGYVIRQTSFPLLAVNLSNLFTELFFLGVGLAFIVCMALVSGAHLGLALLALLPLVLCQLVVTFSLMISIACAGVYFRDLSSFITLGLNLMFLASPGIYEADKLPALAQKIQLVNPFYYLFPAYRQVLLHNQWPNLAICGLWTLIGVVLTVLSMRLYGRVRPNFLRVL